MCVLLLCTNSARNVICSGEYSQQVTFQMSAETSLGLLLKFALFFFPILTKNGMYRQISVRLPNIRYHEEFL
jgi:hypothetical protein